MNLAAIKTHFANWREWEANPIVVKELRQAVRSWTVTGMLLLFLTILFIVSATFLVSTSMDRNQDLQLGAQMFAVFSFILCASSILFIPLYMGVRVAAERVESNLDLLYVSTLSPTRIILGKFLCGAYVALLFFSACLPFMAFTNLLRGIDLPSIFFTMFNLYLVVCAISQINIFLACLPIGRPLKILLALLSLIGCFIMVGSFSVGMLAASGRGISGFMTDPSFWASYLLWVAIGAAFVGLFFVLSITLISPPSANRAWLPRIYITLFWVVSLVITLLAISNTGNEHLIDIWSGFTLLTMSFALPVCTSNNDQLSPRTRRKIPQSFGRRMLVFPFFNGAASGLVWVSAITIITLAITFFILHNFHLTHSPSRFTSGYVGPSAFAAAVSSSGTTFDNTGQLKSLIAVILYAFAYNLLALFLHRKFMRQRPPKIVGVLALILIALGALVPNIILFFLNRLTIVTVESLQIGNMFNAWNQRDDDLLRYHFIFAGGFFVIMLLLNQRWFWQQLRNFRPEPAEVPPPLN